MRIKIFDMITNVGAARFIEVNLVDKSFSLSDDIKVETNIKGFTFDTSRVEPTEEGFYDIDEYIAQAEPGSLIDIHLRKASQNLADRQNDSKPQLSYIFDSPHAIEGLVRRFEYGAEKYAKDNYKKGFPWLSLLDSFDRHRMAFQNGEDIDPEDGQPHVAVMLWNAFILCEEYYTRKDLDDRYKKEGE